MSSTKELILPQMGCGTWAWGNRLLWGYDQSMDPQLQAVFNLCVSNGVTLFDTGDSYGTGKLNGQSEKLLGKFEREYQGVNKERICLATKLAAYPWRLTAKSMVKAGIASIERMGRVDLAQLHWSTANYFPWQEWQLLDGLADLYERGVIKGVGLSNYGTKRLRQVQQKFSDRNIPIATLQVQYSLLSTYPITELGLKDTCDELGIKLIAYSPLCLGILTGKYNDPSTYPKGLRGILFRRLVPEAKPLLDCLEAIAQSRHKTMAQVAINWCIAKGAMPIPGAKNIKQAQENIAAQDWLLDAGEIAELDRAAANIPRAMVQNIFQSK
ncbi:aldo/keto reductase [Pleurocapsa sp. CCALA 161]|uniref:aldo/keto reductase n=1 Tax=Pleurocapsa sp. CCALA 161 TaxID=2107688 RepID=UPI000D082897|nr:aldo/keto reductase [Pleurocapsa sp. CCALA 161]